MKYTVKFVKVKLIGVMHDDLLLSTHSIVSFLYFLESSVFPFLSQKLNFYEERKSFAVILPLRSDLHLQNFLLTEIQLSPKLQTNHFKYPVSNYSYASPSACLTAHRSTFILKSTTWFMCCIYRSATTAYEISSMIHSIQQSLFMNVLLTKLSILVTSMYISQQKFTSRENRIICHLQH